MSLGAGVLLFPFARRMGASVETIAAPTGTSPPNAEEYVRGLLDAYDARNEA